MSAYSAADDARQMFQRAQFQSEQCDRNVDRVEWSVEWLCREMTSSYHPDMLLHNNRLVNGYVLFAPSSLVILKFIIITRHVVVRVLTQNVSGIRVLHTHRLRQAD